MMKTLTYFLKRTAIILSSLFLFLINIQAQDAKEKKRDAQTIQQLLESKEFVFRAQSVTPVGGGFRQLTSEYDLRLLGDSLVSYLPYFGRAHTAPLDPQQSGIQFTSTDFSYEVKSKKKGWDIQLQPKDVASVQQMHLNVTTSGRASLLVISTNREPISFNGVIAQRR